ncbi:lipoyl(octanoyl) transferase LipB [Pseudenhygromyxa sp. WMMC2535]|uniref:lipoyl(octanoyl) transferase LipB n=1 Tax=Pseudenhygromyxa sp. WMMC2535 TaxID=2712867 RepID=UPI001552893F|nr:lipoyl(octanoyl) transferase LipB [Pseudenhygromyxa sp. WMMC2535]NVB42207.1 lipoyl(octanoyl) transferase LipB [Pseudenhygromyxa sp. WMMC2535]
MSASRELAGRWVGRMDFAPCLQEQLRARDAILEGSGPETLIMVEHPPTLTLGRRGRREDVVWTDEQLAEEQVAVCETPRGGEVTLHAPGQLVAYPIVRIDKQIRAHIQHMSDATIALLGELGIDGVAYRDDHPGIWRGEAKISSLGIHISRGVTVQGMSLNLAVAPKLFGALVSCGMPGIQMTSVADLREEPLPPMEQLARRWAELFAERAGYALRWS